MKDWYDFSNRANINSYSYGEKKIFIYQDHRTILNALFFAGKYGLIDSIPNVVYFDYHEDYCDPPDDVKQIAKTFNLENHREEDFNTMVEFKLRALDDDWVKTGKEFNLINNSISIGAKGYDESASTYIDVKGREHHHYNLSHLSYSLSESGALEDSAIKQPYYKEVREIFDYNSGIGENHQPFILDFDLDCFSAEFNSTQMAWPEWMFKKEMHTRVGFYQHISPHDFIQSMIEKCEFITICLESTCCGGYGESYKILNYLDKYIFNGNLNTEKGA